MPKLRHALGQFRKSVQRQRVSYPYRSWNLELRTVFIHIPKCGGTSVLESLGVPTRPRVHADWNQYYSSDPELYRSCFRFSFVRHPLRRLESAYAYVCAGSNGSDFGVKLAAQLKRIGPSYSAFLDRFDADLAFQYPQFRPQWTYVLDQFDELQVDLVGRTESFEESIDQLSRHMNRPISAVHANQSSDKQTVASYPRHVIEIYRKDFEVFGYRV
ncbi:MAG: sulfotransferase family 2 domain-containing protein [Planctomycetota bacterium]